MKYVFYKECSPVCYCAAVLFKGTLRAVTACYVPLSLLEYCNILLLLFVLLKINPKQIKKKKILKNSD